MPTIRRLVLLAALLAGCGGPAPASAPEVVKTFVPGQDQPITSSGVAIEQGTWRISPSSPGSIRLFEVPGEPCDGCRLIYRAKMRTSELRAPAYLEMWVRAPGKGEFFSKGLDQTVQETNGWASYEVPFFLRRGEKIDLAKLNVAFEGGGGTLWIKDVELVKAAL